MTSDIVERLRAKHDDTWPQQIGYGDLINQDGPEAADEIERLRSLLKEAGEINRTFVAMLALDSEEECAEVAEQLGIEDGGQGLWALSQRYAMLKAREQQT